MTAPREREGWRWTIYSIVTGPRFPAIRFTVWAAQIPLCIARPSLLRSTLYLVVLSIAAGNESALTDWTEGWKFVAENEEAGHG